MNFEKAANCPSFAQTIFLALETLAFARFLNFTQNPKNKLLNDLSVHEIYPVAVFCSLSQLNHCTVPDTLKRESF